MTLVGGGSEPNINKIWNQSLDFNLKQTGAKVIDTTAIQSQEDLSDEEGIIDFWGGKSVLNFFY